MSILRNAAIYSNSTYTKPFYKLVVVSVLFIVSLQSQAQTALSREYNIKAAFLYNFTQFVDWPANSFASANAPFIIGILGNDPFGLYIDHIVANEKIQNHPIVISRFKELSDVKNCQVLFISSNQAPRLNEIFSQLSLKNILTVSDIPDFAKAGGMVCLVTKENKIKLQINYNATKAADLNVSSKLLRVAEIINASK